MLQTGEQVANRRSIAARLFGYDLFFSFALGPPPRGTLSYASDLARRLRERDFTVFLSEDEAPPGEHLDKPLRKALHRSRILVVTVNRRHVGRAGVGCARKSRNSLGATPLGR